VDLNPPGIVYYLPLVLGGLRSLVPEVCTAAAYEHAMFACSARFQHSAQPLLDSPVPPGMIVIAVVVAAPTHWLCYVLAFSLNRLHHIDVRFDSLGAAVVIDRHPLCDMSRLLAVSVAAYHV